MVPCNFVKNSGVGHLKGCRNVLNSKQTYCAPPFFFCDYEYLWQTGKSQTRDAETLVNKKKKFEKMKNSRFIEEFVTRYKSFRDFKIGEKDSDHLKAMVAETNSEGLLLGIAIFVPRGRRFFWSKAEWLRGRE